MVRWGWPFRSRRWQYLVVLQYREGGDLAQRWVANGTVVPSLNGADDGAMLNYFGARGWELVGRQGWYFKRPSR